MKLDVTLTRWLKEFFFPERGVLRPGPFAAVALLGILLGVGLSASDFTQSLDLNVYDRFMRAATRDAGPAPGIVVVAVDELSVKELGLPLPWPRELHAQLIDALARAGAQTIVMDILFLEPGIDPAQDTALVEAVRAAGNVVLGADRELIVDRAFAVTQWSRPFPELAQAAAGVGLVRLTIDPDGILRRTPLDLEFPTLALATARRQPGFQEPADPERPRLIRYNGPPRRGIATVSYYQALDPEQFLPAGTFDDKIVLVGLSLAAPTTEVADHMATPVAQRMAGVEIHANLIDTLLRDRAIADPFHSFTLLAFLCVMAGLAAALVLYRLGPIAGLATLFVAAAIFIAVGYVSLASYDTRVPVLSPILAVLGVFAATESYRFALGNRERRLIKRAFRHYVAPSIVEQMLQDPSRLKLGGEEYQLTVMFTDLEGFTALSEKLTPVELRRHLTGYFKEMMEVLLAEGATLDKFLGDALMVYFGCPIRVADHPDQACRAALAMQLRMVDLNRSWAEQGLPALRMRVGVNTGNAVAGNMGTDEIFNYTIMGECVNLAARLEGVNKEYGTLTIIGEDTRSVLGDGFELRELDRIRVKGKDHPAAIYELLAPAGSLTDSQRRVLEHFAAGLALYRERKWEAASAEFSLALETDPDDGPSRTFLKRCAVYALDPPPVDWNSVHIMTTK